ncbi:MAG: methylmalonyl-CoA mutase, partial [Polaribacter sp.]
MSNSLFDEFDSVSPTAWKQKIQVDLKGADYNETLLWKTEEGIVVKPFYTKEDRTHQKIAIPKEDFTICQTIFIDDVKIANSLAIKVLQRGATAIQFKANSTFDYKTLLQNIDVT